MTNSVAIAIPLGAWPSVAHLELLPRAARTWRVATDIRVGVVGLVRRLARRPHGAIFGRSRIAERSARSGLAGEALGLHRRRACNCFLHQVGFGLLVID